MIEAKLSFKGHIISLGGGKRRCVHKITFATHPLGAFGARQATARCPCERGICACGSRFSLLEGVHMGDVTVTKQIMGVFVITRAQMVERISERIHE